jgi:zinc transport system substrate-binding protein
MNLSVRRLLFTLAILIFSSACTQAGERLQVAVSIIPQKILVERIGGPHVQALLMVQPGHNPATYEPGPRQMADLARADLYYRIGVPFERVWMARILDNYPGLAVLDARDGIELRQMEDAAHEGHGHGHDHHAAEPDPHIWLSPPLIRVMALRLRDRLIALDPSHRDGYMHNHALLDAALVRLDGDIRSVLSVLSVRRFMVYHPSWGYFADSYGLQQLAIESGGREPGAQSLARLLDMAREQGVGSIFVQKQFSQVQARALADAVNARVVVIDPLASDYPENLLDVARAMVQGL